MPWDKITNFTKLKVVLDKNVLTDLSIQRKYISNAHTNEIPVELQHHCKQHFISIFSANKFTKKIEKHRTNDFHLDRPLRFSRFKILDIGILLFCVPKTSDIRIFQKSEFPCKQSKLLKFWNHLEEIMYSLTSNPHQPWINRRRLRNNYFKTGLFSTLYLLISRKDLILIH